MFCEKTKVFFSKTLFSEFSRRFNALIKLPFTFHKYRKLTVHKSFRVKAINSPLKNPFHPKSR